MPYWVTFDGAAEYNGKKIRGICVDTQGDSVRAHHIAAAIGPIASVDVLPYPANPRIDDENDPPHKWGRCPSFCYTPEQCKGNSCCRKSYACSE